MNNEVRISFDLKQIILFGLQRLENGQNPAERDFFNERNLLQHAGVKNLMVFKIIQA